MATADGHRAAAEQLAAQAAAMLTALRIEPGAGIPPPVADRARLRAGVDRPRPGARDTRRSGGHPMIDVENSPLREGRVEILPNLFDMQDGQRRELRIEIRAGGLEREAHCPHCNGLVTRTGTDAGTVIQDGVDDMSREVMRRGGFPGDSNIRDVVLDYVVTLWPCGHRFRYAVPR